MFDWCTEITASVRHLCDISATAAPRYIASNKVKNASITAMKVLVLSPG